MMADAEKTTNEGKKAENKRPFPFRQQNSAKRLKAMKGTKPLLKLTSREKSELIFEGIFTAALMFLIYMGISLLMGELWGVYLHRMMLENAFDSSLQVTITNFSLYKTAFDLAVMALGAAVIYWRLSRRYRQMQLRHVLAELHYIASGHFDYQIPFKVEGELKEVVNSINSLVANTVASMEEERQIEQSKDELITNVSHDIRTPLTSIIGYLGLVKNEHYDSEEDRKRYVEIAENKAQQMKHLVDDLFEYTTTRSVKRQLNKQEVDLARFMEQIAAEFEWEANRKGLKIEIDETLSALSLKVPMDPVKMVRVFGNIITNAMKYGENSTYIRLSAQVDEEKKVIHIRLANNGTPIPEESLDQLFQRFYRVEDSRSVETGGAGLGLAISENIVRLHQGTIEAQSTEEETAFIVTLPLKAKDFLGEKSDEGN